MAKCDLLIELDEPHRIYVGGEKVTGTVTVLADENVKCKSLEIKSSYRTHGRGNVASGTGETLSVFSGEWQAGQREAYRFELMAADWPPSYHGNYINVDHYIDARAKIPWAFDPKASTEFMMRPLTGPADAATGSSSVGHTIGLFIGVFVVVIAVLALSAGFVAAAQSMVGILIMSVLTSLVVGGILFKFYLPKWLLGEVECELLTPQTTPGGTIRARLSFQPRRAVPINAITATLQGKEICVSGSGSNATTHTNVFFDDETVIRSQSVLGAGIKQSFDYEFKLPNDVPFSFTLTNNKVIWSVAMRVDIPRWPDWSSSLAVKILPDGSPPPPSAVSTETDPQDSALEFSENATDEITFAETAGHLWELRDHPDQVDTLVEAVVGMTFDLDTFVERRLLYSGQEDPHVYKDGYAVWARHSEPPLPLVLYVPHSMGDEFEQAGRDLWRCRGTIVGWDHDHRRLQVKVIG